MTDAAIPRSGLPHPGRNGIAPTLVPSAVLCALVVATGASYIHWSKPAPIAAPIVAEPPAAPVRTWVIERPRAESKTASGPDAAALAAATQKLAKAAATAERASAPADSAAAVPASSPQKIVVAKADIGPLVEAGPPVVPPMPSVATPAERVPLPPPRPAYLRMPKDDVVPAERPAAVKPNDDSAQRPAVLAPPAQDPVAPPQPPIAATPPQQEAVAPPRDETPRQRRRRLARQTPASQAGPEDKRNALEKLFGIGDKPSRTVTAYAPQDGGFSLGGLFGGPRSSPSSSSSGGGTAIYDISAHTVYLPDGRRLEAHSGLGQHLDDPRSVRTPNRGATPPNVYDLTVRESPFHGVRALRLNPVGSGGTFGRNGLLAHTFMLGSRGDSNGCVVFRDYNAFLQAYESGAIKRLQVVSSR